MSQSLRPGSGTGSGGRCRTRETKYSEDRTGCFRASIQVEFNWVQQTWRIQSRTLLGLSRKLDVGKSKILIPIIQGKVLKELLFIKVKESKRFKFKLESVRTSTKRPVGDQKDLWGVLHGVRGFDWWCFSRRVVNSSRPNNGPKFTGEIRMNTWDSKVIDAKCMTIENNLNLGLFWWFRRTVLILFYRNIQFQFYWVILIDDQVRWLKCPFLWLRVSLVPWHFSEYRTHLIPCRPWGLRTRSRERFCGPTED